jgi:hypothetical protein
VTTVADSGTRVASPQLPLERPAPRAAPLHEPALGSVVNPDEPNLQTARDRRLERRRQEERERYTSGRGNEMLAGRTSEA